MIDPLYEQILTGVGVAFLALLCLPIAGLRKFVLETYALGLRLALLAVLAGGVYLWYRPQQMPPQVTNVLNAEPWLASILPAPGNPYFGICGASLIVVSLLPCLAGLDVARKLAGWRTKRLRALADRPIVVEETVAVQTGPGVVERRVNRRTAATALSDAGSRITPRTTR